MLTLGDLIEQTGLGLELVTGDNRALERAVVGAHSMEVPRPCRWLEPDWIMLTIGMRLRDAPKHEYRRLIADAADGGLAALGFGVKMVFDDVPKPLLDEATRRKFPIFIVPEDAQFRTIIDFVHRSLDSEQMSVLHRSLSLQRYLMDALSSPEPRDDLLTRLAKTLQCDAAIYRHDGRVLLARGSIDFERVWGEVTARDPREQVFSLGTTQVLSFPILVDGRPLEWLVLTARRALATPLVAREVARSAARLLGSISQVRRIAVLEERAVAARLLARLGSGDIGPSDIDRLQAFGFNIASGTRVVIIEDMSPPAEDHAQRIADLVERRLITEHVPHLSQVRERSVVVLVGDDNSRLDGLMAELAHAGLSVRAGLGRVVHRVEQVVTSAHDATLSLARLGRTGAPAGAIACDSDFGLAEWLVQGADADAVVERASLVLEKLKQHPDLYETLQVYLRENLNVKAAAHALDLHPNSLRYRLTRVEDLVGRRLEDASTIVDLSLAVLVEQTTRPVA